MNKIIITDHKSIGHEGQGFLSEKEVRLEMKKLESSYDDNEVFKIVITSSLVEKRADGFYKGTINSQVVKRDGFLS